MKRAAIGFRMHSGWGALVAVSHHAGTVKILERRRIVAWIRKFLAPSSPITSLSASNFPKRKIFSTAVLALRSSWHSQLSASRSKAFKSRSTRSLEQR